MGLFEKFKLRHSETIEIEDFIISKILETPNNKITEEQFKKLFNKYQHGTFTLEERRSDSSFLFDEEQNFEVWLRNAISNTLILLKKDIRTLDVFNQYSEEELIQAIEEILHFKTSTGESFLSLIPNQFYTDIISKCFGLLLFDDANHDFITAEKFNNFGRVIIREVIQNLNYDLFTMFKLSQRAGVIGGNLKGISVDTPFPDRNPVIPIDMSKSKEEIKKDILANLKDYASNGPGFAINDWKIFEAKVLNNYESQTLVWFTDDYIPTMFELKFIEMLLLQKPNITFYLVPRCLHAQNDITYQDVLELLHNEDIYKDLLLLYKERRFNVFDKGPDTGAFDGYRLSKNCADLMLNADIIFVSGARSLETAQGINKPTFYIGVAVLRSYSESVTGIGAPLCSMIMVYSENGNHVFKNFKARKTRIIQDEYTVYKLPVAEMTVREYVNLRDK